MGSPSRAKRSYMIQVKIHPRNNWLKECGYTKEEEIKIFDDQLKDILENTAWYLDHFETMKTYRVFWFNPKKKNATFPYKYVKQAKSPKTPKAL